MKKKIECQPKRSIKAPSEGAIAGEASITSVTMAMRLPSSCTGYTSRTIAMQITVANPAPIACTKRNHCTCSTVVDMPIASDASTKITSPIMPMRLRPIWSENAPPKNCPMP